MIMTLLVSARDDSLKPHTAVLDTDCLGEFEELYGTYLFNQLRCRPDMHKVGTVIKNGVYSYKVEAVQGNLFMTDRVYHLLRPRGVGRQQIGVVLILKREQRQGEMWYQFKFGEVVQSLSEQALYAFLTDKKGDIKLTQVQ